MNRPLSRKTTWLIWRARLSIPALLARYDDKKVLSLVTAIHAGLAILLIGVFAWLTHLPLVFTALGPSAFILFSAPLSPAAAPRTVILSHALALTPHPADQLGGYLQHPCHASPLVSRVVSGVVSRVVSGVVSRVVRGVVSRVG